MRTTRSLGRMPGAFWSVLLVLVMGGSLALNVMMAVVPEVAAQVGWIVGRATGLPSVTSRHTAREAALRASVAQAEAAAAAARRAAEADRGIAEAAVRRSDAQAADAARALADARRLADRAAAASRITYRGLPATPAEAVADTVDRYAALALQAGSARVSSSYAEALPILGIGMIAASTEAQLDAACRTMAALNELNIALNPGRAPSAEARAVCAVDAPGRDDLWQAATRDPATLWADARALYPDLPALQIGPQWQTATGMWQAVYDWAYGTPAGPPDATGQGPAGPPAAIAPSDWQN